LQGSLTTTDCDITFNGTGTSTFQYNYATNQQFNNIKGGNGASAILNYRSTLTSTTTEWNSYENLHATGTCDKNKKIKFTGSIPWVNNNGTWSGANNTEWDPPIATCTLNLPATHSDLTLVITQRSSGLATINQMDAFDGASFSLVTNTFGSDWTWNTNNNDTTATASITFKANNSSADGILNAGSSDITCGGNLILYSSISGSNFDLGTGTWKFAGNCNITWTNGTFNANASTIEANGTGTQQITFGGQTLNVLKTTNTAGELQIMDASHCDEWDFSTSGVTIKLKESVNHQVDTTASINTATTLQSLSDGVQWDFVNPVGMAVSGIDVKDSNASNVIDAYTALNTDSGNNSVEWEFSASGGEDNKIFNRDFNREFQREFN